MMHARINNLPTHLLYISIFLRVKKERKKGCVYSKLKCLHLINDVQREFFCGWTNGGKTREYILKNAIRFQTL